MDLPSSQLTQRAFDLDLGSESAERLSLGLQSEFSWSSLASRPELRNWVRWPVQELASLYKQAAGTGGEPSAICAAVQSAISNWDEDRNRDAMLLNEFEAAARGIFLAAYSVGFSSEMVDGPGFQNRIEELRGFGAVEVEAVLPLNSEDLEEAIGQVAEREFLSVAFEAPPAQRVDLIDTLATSLAACCGLEIPFRIVGLPGSLLTNGIDLGALNCLAASVLAFTDEISPKLIAEILRSESAIDWSLGPSHIQFRQLRVDGAAIEEARQVVRGVACRSYESLLTH